jgi:hypothetical protein
MKFRVHRFSIGNWSLFTRSSLDSEKRSQRRSSSAVMVSPVFAEESDTRCQVSMTNGHKNSITNGVVIANGTSKHTSTSPSRLTELAQMIAKETETLDKYLKESGCSTPSFDINAPMDFPNLPDDIKKTRQTIIECTQELRDLVVGPTEGIRWMAWDVSWSLYPSISAHQPSLSHNRVFTDSE